MVDTNNTPDTPATNTTDAAPSAKVKKPRAPRVDPIAFALFWDKAESKAEVCKHFNMTSARATQKAQTFRDNGVPLKVFPKSNVSAKNGGWEALKAKLAEDRVARGVPPDAFPIQPNEKPKVRKKKEKKTDGAAAAPTPAPAAAPAPAPAASSKRSK